MQSPLVSIITVNFNQAQLTCELLASIAHLNDRNFEVIVVDNGSNIDPSAQILQQFPDVRFLRSEENLGFAGGNNLGIKAAKGEYLFLVNNDTELSPDVIGQLLSVFEQQENVGVVSPKICFHQTTSGKQEHLIQYVGYTRVHPITARNKTLGEFEPDKGQYNQVESTFYAHGAAMMIKKEVVEKAGLMPELYFLYYEELDWCEQIRKAGFTIMVEPNAVVYHKESMSVGKASPMKTYYLTRNRILFMRRNTETWQFALFIVYFTFIITPKSVLTYLLRRQINHLRSFVAGISWHFHLFKSPIHPQLS